MLRRNQRFMKILFTNIVIVLYTVNSIIPMTVFADTQSKPILNMPQVETPGSSNSSLSGTVSSEGSETESFIGKTSPIEGTVSGTISIPGVGSSYLDTNLNINPIDVLVTKDKNKETIYPLVVNNIFNSNGTYLNIPQELISSNILKEVASADIVEWRNFDNSNKMNITYNPLMADEYKRALTWLSENNVIHPFPEYALRKDGTTIKQTTSLITSPYQTYKDINGTMHSAPINKADFIMTLMKAVDGVQWSRPLITKSEEQDVKQVEPILDSIYRKDFLTKIGNLDVSQNIISLDRSKYQMQSVYMNPNVYELYFTAAINNGIVDITDFSDSNQFIYDYIGWQTFRLQGNKDDGLKDNGINDKDTAVSYGKAYPRWLVRNQAMKLDSSNPSSAKVTYIPGSKPFGESYTYGTTEYPNIYLGDGLKEQSSLKQENEPNIITQYLSFSSAEKSYASKYKELVNQLPALYRLTQEDTTPFDTNSMREVSIKYDSEKAKTYFNTNELTYMDAFNYIYKALKSYDSANLTNLETEIITSKFGLRFKDLSSDDKAIVNYLVAKGIINPEEYDSYIVNSTLTQEDAYILLYRLCNKDARYNTNFSVSQTELEMVRQGYVQTTVKMYQVGANVTDISVSIDSDSDNVASNGYFPLYITTENGEKAVGYLTDKNGERINLAYTAIETSSKNGFIAFLVPNKYLNQNIRLTLDTSGNSAKTLTGIQGSGIYVIPNSNSTENKLSKYSLISDSTSPAKVIDIRKHILQNTNTNDTILTPDNPVDNSEKVVLNEGTILTSGLKVYKYSKSGAVSAQSSSIADSSSSNYLAFIGDISKIKAIKKDNVVIETNRVDYKDDNRTYLNLKEDITNMDIELELTDGTIIPFKHNSLFYSIKDNVIEPVNIANHYNYTDVLSDEAIESNIKEAHKAIYKIDEDFKNLDISYILDTNYNFSKTKEIKLNLKPSILGLFASLSLFDTKDISRSVVNSKLEAPKVKTSVTLGFNRSSLDYYRYQDMKIFNGSALNSEFTNAMTTLISDIEISDNSTLSGSTTQVQISFQTFQRSAESLLSTLMNKITIAGDLSTESKVAFVSIMAGQEDNRKGVLIPESELGKYNLEAVQDKDGRKNTLRNKETGVSAYLNQALKKAIIGNEIHNYTETALLYSTTDGVNYYNLSVIAELMAIDSLSTSVTSNGIIVPYKTAGYTGSLIPTYIGNALSAQNQLEVDANEYHLLSDDVVLGGSKYVENGRKTQIITTADGVYADLTSTSDSSNGYMISRHPYGSVRRLVIGYELDRTIQPTSVGATSSITSTLDGYINDIKKTPVKTLQSNDSIQKAKDNLVINNTVAHAFMQTEQSYLVNSLTNEYMTKPIINIITYPGMSVDDAYNQLIAFLVKYHTQERTYTFLGSTIKIPISGDIESWYRNKIRLNDSTSPVRVNVVSTVYKDGVIPSNLDVAALVSTDKKWIVTSSGNTLIKVGSSLNDTNGLKELGFRINYANSKVYITNPYIYAGLPTNKVPIEELAPGTTVKLPSGANYTTLDPISTLNYNGNDNMLYTDMAVSLAADNLTKATKIVFGNDEIDIWNNFYKGLKEQAYRDSSGINSNYISDPWKNDLGDESNVSNKILAYRQTLSLLTKSYATKGTGNFAVTTNATNKTLDGPVAYPYMTDKTDSTKITYLHSDTKVTGTADNYVSFESSEKTVTRLDDISNGVILLGRPILRIKYGTVIVDAAVKNWDGTYRSQEFNSGSRYVQKLFIDSPLSELRTYLYNEAADVQYISELPKGARLVTNAGTFIKADHTTGDTTEYTTFISITPDDIEGDSIRNSLTPVALKTAKLLASIQLNGDVGLKIPLLNLADLSSFVPPTKDELENIIRMVTPSDKMYTTLYVDSYSTENVSLKFGNIDGITITETNDPKSNFKAYARFDLNPYIKVIRVGDEKSGNYHILGYDNKGSHATTNSLKSYSALFKMREDTSDPLTLWEEFTGLELANLRIKDRSLYDPMFSENLLAGEANSSVARAESIGYRIKLLMYSFIIGYIICMLAILPLSLFPFVKKTLRRSRSSKIFLKVISLGRIEHIDEVKLEDYYPQLLLALFITVMLFNVSFNLTFLNTVTDITYKIVSVVYENVKIVFNTMYS